MQVNDNLAKAEASSPVSALMYSRGETMFWFKSCPRCHGDLSNNSDNYGNYIACFQCGHYLTAAEDARLRSQNPRGKTVTLPLGEPARVLTEVAA